MRKFLILALALMGCSDATGPVPTDPYLGSAATFGVLAGSAITCITAGTVNGDLGVWPGSAISGFPTCKIVNGAKHIADGTAKTAQGDLTKAILALSAKACGVTISADLGNTTLAPGVYCSASSVGVTGEVTFSGDANAVFIVRAGSAITFNGDVNLIGGAQAKNVYWVAGSAMTVAVNSTIRGNILVHTSITLQDGARVFGRALAQIGGVTLGSGNVINRP